MKFHKTKTNAMATTTAIVPAASTAQVAAEAASAQRQQHLTLTHKTKDIVNCPVDVHKARGGKVR